MSRRRGNRLELCSRPIQLVISLGHFSAVHLQIGGAEGGACLLVHQSLSLGLACKHLQPHYRCSLGGGSCLALGLLHVPQLGRHM